MKNKKEPKLRAFMESYVINNYNPGGKPHFREFKISKWREKVEAMTMAQLAREFEERGGHDFVSELRRRSKDLRVIGDMDPLEIWGLK